MKKSMNKKAQMSTFQLMLMVLGVVAVVIVIIGFSQGWSFFTDIFGKADIDITLISQKCNSELSGGDTAGFCTNKIEIGTNKYINCKYAASNFGAIIEGEASITCTGAEAQICNKIKLEEGDKYKPDKTMVNGKPCYKNSGTAGTDHWNVPS